MNWKQCLYTCVMTLYKSDMNFIYMDTFNIKIYLECQQKFLDLKVKYTSDSNGKVAMNILRVKQLEGEQCTIQLEPICRMVWIYLTPSTCLHNMMLRHKNNFTFITWIHRCVCEIRALKGTHCSSLHHCCHHNHYGGYISGSCQYSAVCLHTGTDLKNKTLHDLQDNPLHPFGSGSRSTHHTSSPWANMVQLS